MADTNVAGSVAVLDDSKHRVALELMQYFGVREQQESEAPRKYWLELYAQCLKVVNFGDVPANLPSRPVHRR